MGGFPSSLELHALEQPWELFKPQMEVSRGPKELGREENTGWSGRSCGEVVHKVYPNDGEILGEADAEGNRELGWGRPDVCAAAAG